MTARDVEVAIVGGGAAGIAAARTLRDAGIDALILEARDRLGGRAWTVTGKAGLPLDLGCGWLHSADRNPWAEIAQQQGRTVDRSRPPWGRPSLPIRFTLEEQADFRKAMDGLFAMVAQEEENIRANPVARTTDLLKKVFATK